ncbi:hypothetical protein ACN38_g1443 [Penicillium nordicum]|uniref:Uncharacterized protein n=1 Tax=Penicillium nordicum TaxID=229535 RepID=A0A0M9WJW7_9EURO|nr:hypothetical protein ACN38_g1443 [Penicillium nordicum]
MGIHLFLQTSSCQAENILFIPNTVSASTLMILAPRSQTAAREWSREHAKGRAWVHGIGRPSAERSKAFRAQMIFLNATTRLNLAFDSLRFTPRCPSQHHMQHQEARSGPLLHHTM